jgi:hypothetical protein
MIEGEDGRWEKGRMGSENIVRRWRCIVANEECDSHVYSTC